MNRLEDGRHVGVDSTQIDPLASTIERLRETEPGLARALQHVHDEIVREQLAPANPLAAKLVRDRDVLVLFEHCLVDAGERGYDWRERACELLNLVERKLVELGRRPRSRTVMRVAAQTVRLYLDEHEDDDEFGALDELEAGVAPPLRRHQRVHELRARSRQARCTWVERRPRRARARGRRRVVRSRCASRDGPGREPDEPHDHVARASGRLGVLRGAA